MFTLALAARALDTWAGGPGRVRELGCKFTKPVVVPDDDAGVEVVVARHRQERHATRACRSRSRSPAATRRCSACPRRCCVPDRRSSRLADLHHAAPRRPGRASWCDATTEDELLDAVRCGRRGRAPRCCWSAAAATSWSPTTGFDGTVVRRRARAGVAVEQDTVRRRLRDGRRGGGLGRASSRAPCPQGWVGVEALSGIPGQRRGHPDPERRRLRPGGRRHGRPGARLGPRRRGCSARSSPPTAASATAPAGSSRSPSATSCSTVTFQLRLGDLGAPVRYAELARTLGVEVGDRAPAADVREAVLGAAPRQGHGPRPRRPRHLERRARSSPTRSCRRRRRLPDGAPRWDAARRHASRPAPPG